MDSINLIIDVVVELFIELALDCLGQVIVVEVIGVHVLLLGWVHHEWLLLGVGRLAGLAGLAILA